MPGPVTLTFHYPTLGALSAVLNALPSAKCGSRKVESCESHIKTPDGAAASNAIKDAAMELTKQASSEVEHAARERKYEEATEALSTLSLNYGPEAVELMLSMCGGSHLDELPRYQQANIVKLIHVMSEQQGI